MIYVLERIRKNRKEYYMVAWYWIPICLSIGSLLGVFVMCLCTMAKVSDEVILDTYKDKHKINNVKYD